MVPRASVQMPLILAMNRARGPAQSQRTRLLFSCCSTTSRVDVSSHPPGSETEATSDTDQNEHSVTYLQHHREDKRAGSSHKTTTYHDAAPEILDTGSKMGMAINSNRLVLSPLIIDAALRSDYESLPQLRPVLFRRSTLH